MGGLGAKTRKGLVGGLRGGRGLGGGSGWCMYLWGWRRGFGSRVVGMGDGVGIFGWVMPLRGGGRAAEFFGGRFSSSLRAVMWVL